MRLALLLSLTMLTPAAAQDPPAQRSAPIAIRNVNVIAMDRPGVLRDQVVIVRDGKIAAVGPGARVKVPNGASVIDGRGGYLTPGLADFHVHIRLRTDLGAYLAYGVTTIADMGTRDILRVWRDSIRAGHTVGPQMFIGYFMEGPTQSYGAKTVEDAIAKVQQADSLGFDFIKVYNALTAEQFEAIMREAKARELAVLGHGVRSVGLRKGFAAGQSMVVHAEEYMYNDLRGRISEEHIPEAVAFTREYGAYVLPNLSAYEAMTLQWGKPDVLEQLLQKPEARWLPKYWIDDWRGRDYIKRPGSIADRYEFLKKLTAALYKAGVPLISGTDSPGIPGMVAGASIHDDLRTLIEAGLTPFDALLAATRTPGEYARKYLKASESFGMIAAGYRADLVLVPSNPLEDMSVLRSPSAVMVHGTWLEAARLRSLLETWAST